MSQSSATAPTLASVLDDYLSRYPEERSRMPVLIGQIMGNEKLNDRANYVGHVTGSAIILNPSRDKVLLIYHPSFSRWQQPGGHFEPEEHGPWVTAMREALEETGVNLDGRVMIDDDLTKPIDIDSHLIPTVPPKNEPEHYHHDFRYVFLAADENLTMEDEVIEKAAWVDIEKIKHKDLKRAVDKAVDLIG